MGWSLVQKDNHNVWVCEHYSDLKRKEINNLAEYGQPWSPSDRGFIKTFTPDFSKIIVEMPQRALMSEGYGANIQAGSFPVVHRFLYEKPPMPYGNDYHFDDLVKYGFARRGDRTIQSNLYGTGQYKLSAGSIDASDAAYIHGTVAFALMKSTRFIYSETVRRVEAEIGALDDNWDFASSTIPDWLNKVVAATMGPSNNKLKAPILLQYRGPGKLSVAQH